MNRAERYREAGVDLDAGDRAKAKIGSLLAGARSADALGAIGAFGGMVRIPPDLADPVLVMSTDSVGTKVLVAAEAGRHDTVGEDLVNHCVNDILVHGARPLAFLDYLGLANVDPDTVESLVSGVARGCRHHGMTLAGGETAELPGLYAPGHYDLAGTIVGVVSESEALHGDRVRAGDRLIGYESSGLHTNGYSLARRIVFDQLRLGVDEVVSDLETTVGDMLLSVHRSYFQAVWPIVPRVHGLAHITGGGIPGNLGRCLPDGLGATVDAQAWPIPAPFAFLERAGNVPRDEMYHVFNMGIGLIAVVPPDAVARVREAAAAAQVPTYDIGEVVERRGIRIG